MIIIRTGTENIIRQNGGLSKAQESSMYSSASRLAIVKKEATTDIDLKLSVDYRQISALYACKIRNRFAGSFSSYGV